MKTLFRFFALCAALILAVTNFTSCDKELLDNIKIVGKWQLTSITSEGLSLDVDDFGEAYYVFESDGTYYMDAADKESGTWKYKEGTLTLTSGDKTATYKVENLTLISMTLVSSGEILGQPVETRATLVKVVEE